MYRFEPTDCTFSCTSIRARALYQFEPTGCISSCSFIRARALHIVEPAGCSPDRTFTWARALPWVEPEGWTLTYARALYRLEPSDSTYNSLLPSTSIRARALYQFEPTGCTSSCSFTRARALHIVEPAGYTPRPACTFTRAWAFPWVEPEGTSIALRWAHRQHIHSRTRNAVSVRTYGRTHHVTTKFSRLHGFYHIFLGMVLRSAGLRPAGGAPLIIIQDGRTRKWTTRKQWSRTFSLFLCSSFIVFAKIHSILLYNSRSTDNCPLKSTEVLTGKIFSTVTGYFGIQCKKKLCNLKFKRKYGTFWFYSWTTIPVGVNTWWKNMFCPTGLASWPDKWPAYWQKLFAGLYTHKNITNVFGKRWLKTENGHLGKIGEFLIFINFNT